MSKRAKRYSKAFFESYPPDSYDAKNEQLQVLKSLWREDAELVSFFENPALSIANKEEAVSEIAGQLDQGDQLLKNFLLVLLENKGLKLIPDIADDFQKRYDFYRESMQLSITTASEITSAEQGKILEYLKDNFGKDVTIEWQTKADLIGGFTVKTGDHLLDSSVAGALGKIKTSLMNN